MASYYTSMLTRARSMEGYTPDLEIVFVGQYVEDPTLCDLWSGTPFIMGGRSTASVQINEYGRLRMIVMSTGMGTRYATDDELAQYADSIAASPNNFAAMLVPVVLSADGEYVLSPLDSSESMDDLLWAANGDYTNGFSFRSVGSGLYFAGLTYCNWTAINQTEDLWLPLEHTDGGTAKTILKSVRAEQIDAFLALKSFITCSS